LLRRRLAHIRNALAASPLAYIPGHYYSPICEPREIRKWYRDPEACDREVSLPGIELRRQHQIDRLLGWRKYFPMQFPEYRTAPWRYYHGDDNGMYLLGDAICLYCLIRDLKPKRYVEIGSGFSSACVLDTIDRHSLDLTCTFIDPEPQRLQRLLNPGDDGHVKLLPRQVQDVPLETFTELEPGDILLIDSSHVMKTSSDVALEIFSILPQLRPGVFIHFHDIFYPFEYPPEWAIERNYSWNEIYGLRAFLMYNSKFRIEFWNDYLVKTSTKTVADLAPDMIRHSGGSIWLSVQEAAGEIDTGMPA